MIYLQTDKFQIDVSSFGVQLNEESDYFNDDINRSYSLPFSIKGDAELLSKLGIPTLDNIVDLDTEIQCQLVLPDRFYPATLFLGEVHGQEVECNITFGHDDLPEYKMKLKDLPWPKVLTTAFKNLANSTREKEWPATPYNFPMLYRPGVREDSNHEAFEGFVNNHNGTTYLENEVDASGEYINRNVMAPLPYLLEILRFGYETAGKKIFGDVFEHDLLKKALYVPENYMENYRGSDYQQFSFSTPDGSEFSAAHYGVYRKTLVPGKPGTYDIDFDINLDPVLARDFVLNIYTIDAVSQDKTLVHRSASRYNRVRLDEKVSISFEEAEQYDSILVELKISHTTEDISQYNSFEYNFQGGRLNQFPNSFSLSQFMPDMTFGEFVNELKNWWNLDVDVQDRYVEINFLQDSILKKKKEKHTHLEVPGKTRASNLNRFYKLSYANGDRVLYTKDGQVYSELDEKGREVIEIEMDVQPLVVEQNENVITAVFPEENSKIDFCLYGGIDSKGRPTCSASLYPALQINALIDNFWANWLNFRIHSKSFKESFECSVYERINIDELSFKYNELHVIKKLQKKFISEKVMKVDVESETF